MTKRVYFLAHGGVVQGVSFRYNTRLKAQELNLTGWVRNVSHDKVEGEAQGDEKDVDALMECVGAGPARAVVAKLDKEERDLVEGELGFKVWKSVAKPAPAEGTTTS